MMEIMTELYSALESNVRRVVVNTVLHSITNVYFLWRPMITMLYPASNYFDSWVFHIPLNRRHINFKEKAPTNPNI